MKRPNKVWIFDILLCIAVLITDYELSLSITPLNTHYQW